MRIVVYGEGMTYDVSACCGHCGFRHVARMPVGTRINTRAACASCGLSGTVVYGTTEIASLWLRDPQPLRCVRCARSVSNPTDAVCDECWKGLFLYAVMRSEPAVNPYAAQFSGLPPVPLDDEGGR